MKMTLAWLWVAIGAGAAGFDHAPWGRVLAAAVNPIGEVDYAALKGNADLKEYVAALAAASPRNRPDLFAGRADELAYYINAYNAITTAAVVERYPLKSVGESLVMRARFFRFTRHTVGGERISLEDLENKILRAQYREPRIHFAIVCASLSCPKLAREPYTKDNLEAMLERETRRYFAETRNLAVEGDTVLLPVLLDWYREDFEAATGRRGKQAALAYALRYTTPAKRGAVEAIRAPRAVFRDYDWSINEPGSRARARSAAERELARPESGARE
jgi:hypothetical protein